MRGFLALLHRRGALNALRLGDWPRSSHLCGGSLAKQSLRMTISKKIVTIKWPKAGKLQKVPFFLPLKGSAPKIGIRGRHCLRQTGEERTQTLVTRALLATAHAFGFRKRELLELSVRRVDSLNRSIRLNARETKSGDSRVVNMTQDVFILLQSCVLGRAAEDFVFTQHDGNPVLDFRERWRNQTTLAGCADPLICCSIICDVPPSAT